MLTKGEIQTIDYNNNTGTVRVPLFESAGKNTPVIIDAIFAIPPGIFNGYKVGDVVELGFENNELTPAVVVGKLYLGASEEVNSACGSVYGDSLKIHNSAELPISTRFSSDKSEQVADTDTNQTSFSSIADLVEEINKLRVQVAVLETKLNSLE